MGTLTYGRDEVDTIVREVGNAWWEKAREVVPPLLEAAVAVVAGSRGVDSGYVWWRLLNDRRTWSEYPNAAMLDVALRLFLMSVTRSHEPEPRFKLPDTMEGEKQVDEAVKGLVKWADGKFFLRVVDILLNLVEAAAKRVQRAVSEISGQQISEKQASLVVLMDLQDRTRDHPFWFRDPLAVRLLMQRVNR